MVEKDNFLKYFEYRKFFDKRTSPNKGTLLRSAVGIAHVLRSVLVMGYAT